MNRKLVAGIFLVLILIGALVMSQHGKSAGTDTLRVAFPYAKPASTYEPARIHLAPEYIFLENIYSPLVELSPKTGEVEPGVAESYRWKENELHLKIRKDLRTVTGQTITAADAEFSLKRLLALPGNTHGDFRELICGNTKFQSVEEHCDGIRVQGDELILKTTTAGKTFLLPMLAAIDFAIIPKSAVDPGSLAIRDFRNTTGAYYVSRDSEEGKIQLRANPNHYHYSPTMPQVIELVPTDLKNPHASFDDFSAGRVDFITTIDAARADDVIAYSRTQSDSVLHTTMNIRSFVLSFSDRGLKELSPGGRFAVGRAVRDAYKRAFAGQNGYEESKQFFPAFGEGALDKNRMEAIEKKYDSAAALPSQHLKIAFVRLGDTSKFAAALKEVLPNAEISEQAKNTSFTTYASPSEMPHITICGPDTGFLEDIGLISYTLNAGYFGMDKDARQKWLQNYMSITEKGRRLELLRNVHESALSEPVIVPLLVAPYAALARKPWKVGLSQLYANNQLWLIQKN
jgi:MarR-like DNA-binding transcriptional regulator SgrR of sgrS sRNA